MAQEIDPDDIESILNVQNEHIRKLHQIVLDSIREEGVLVSNLMHPPADKATLGQRISDKVARFGGSWTFIVSFIFLLTIWIIYNVSMPNGDRFDPYPFILMNLVLSCVAAFQAPVIMMSQNRQEEKDRLHAQSDYMVNLKAELEVRSLHQKIDLLAEEQIKSLFEIQAKQMEMLKSIETRINKAENN